MSVHHGCRNCGHRSGLEELRRDLYFILGHARIAVTLEIYTDSDLPSQRSALDKVTDELFPGAEDGS